MARTRAERSRSCAASPNPGTSSWRANRATWSSRSDIGILLRERRGGAGCALLEEHAEALRLRRRQRLHREHAVTLLLGRPRHALERLALEQPHLEHLARREPVERD